MIIKQQQKNNHIPIFWRQIFYYHFLAKFEALLINEKIEYIVITKCIFSQVNISKETKGMLYVRVKKEKKKVPPTKK